MIINYYFSMCRLECMDGCKYVNVKHGVVVLRFIVPLCSSPSF